MFQRKRSAEDFAEEIKAHLALEADDLKQEGLNEDEARRKAQQVVWMILKDSLLLTAVGVVIGIPLAMLVGRALTSSLYGVKPSDALSYLLAVAGVALVALAASAVPAVRAALVNPLTALRAE